eukprot:568932-Prorocentrum_minimum.AAC.4
MALQESSRNDDDPSVGSIIRMTASSPHSGWFAGAVRRRHNRPRRRPRRFKRGAARVGSDGSDAQAKSGGRRAEGGGDQSGFSRLVANQTQEARYILTTDQDQSADAGSAGIFSTRNLAFASRWVAGSGAVREGLLYLRRRRWRARAPGDGAG